MQARSIVAIEIASSKVKGAVAIQSGSGSFEVLSVVTVPVLDSVRHGRVKNIREVSAAVNELIHRLEADPKVAPRRIENVVVAKGGRSLEGDIVSASMAFSRELEISEKTIDRLKSEATKDFIGNKLIVDVIPRMFWVNNMLVRPVVGTIGTNIRGEFMLITCGKETKANLEHIKYDSIRAGSVSYVIRPIALADFILSNDQKQIGCALVDFGAETCTVSVYKNGVLSFLSTLPMGSRLITKDLVNGLRLTETAAEDFKLRLGNLQNTDSDDPNAREINNYVRARAGEIAANIVAQIERAGLAPAQLGAGIVLTGGGASLPGFDSLLAGQSKMKVSLATIPATVSFANSKDDVPANIDVLSIINYALRTSDTEGLSPVPAAPAHPEEDDVESLFNIDDQVQTPADTRQQPIEDMSLPERPHTLHGGRRYHSPMDEDDPDLLLDDDDDTPRKPAKTTDHSRFMPQPAPVEEEEDDDYEEEFDDDDENEYGFNEEDENVKPKNSLPKNPKKSIFTNLRDKAASVLTSITDIFAPAPPEEGDDDENGDDDN